MEKIIKRLLGLVAMLSMPVAQRDEKVLAKELAELKTDMEEAKGLGDVAKIAELQTQMNDLKKQHDELIETNRKMRKMNLATDGNQVHVLNYDEIISLRRVGQVFRSVEAAQSFGAMAARAIFGQQGQDKYKAFVSEKARGMADEIVKAMEPGASGAGAELVQNLYMADMISHVEAVGVLFNRCRRIPLATMGQTILPKRTGGLTAYPIAALGALQESTAALTTITLQPEKWGVLTVVGNEMFRDPNLLAALGQFLAFEITRAISYAFDNALVNGDGTATYGGITGLLQSSNIGATAPTADHETLAALTAFDIGEFVAGVTKDYVKEPYWMFSLSAERALRNIRGGVSGDYSGQAVFERGSNGEPNTIDGYPYQVCQRFPAKSSITAGVKFGAFGDLMLSHIFGTMGNIEIAQSEHVRFESDATAIRGIVHCDCVEQDADAITILQTHS